MKLLKEFELHGNIFTSDPIERVAMLLLLQHVLEQCKRYCTMNIKCTGCILICNGLCKWIAIKDCEQTETTGGVVHQKLYLKPGKFGNICIDLYKIPRRNISKCYTFLSIYSLLGCSHSYWRRYRSKGQFITK